MPRGVYNRIKSIPVPVPLQEQMQGLNAQANTKQVTEIPEVEYLRKENESLKVELLKLYRRLVY